MNIKIFLGLDNNFYLAKNSCLRHCHHPCQKSEVILCGQKDMDQCDIDLLTLLFSVNVSPIQISQVMEQIKGPQSGTFTPKHPYIMNQRTEDLQKFALGLLPNSNDAKKNIAELELLVCVLFITYQFI